MLRFTEIYIIFDCLIENPLVYLAERGICYKIPLQIRKELEFFLRILRIQTRPEQIIKLICLKLPCRIRDHFRRQPAACRHRIKHLGKPRLKALRQISICHQLRIKQVKLVHRRLFTEGQIRYDHIILTRHIKNGIEQMGLSLTVFSADDHPGRFLPLADILNMARKFLKYFRTRIGKAPSHDP